MIDIGKLYSRSTRTCYFVCEGV